MLLIVTEDGKLLLHHRENKPGIAHPDCWAGFGGAVDDGERIEDAVTREMREETGVAIDSPIFLTRKRLITKATAGSRRSSTSSVESKRQMSI